MYFKIYFYREYQNTKPERINVKREALHTEIHVQPYAQNNDKLMNFMFVDIFHAKWFPGSIFQPL